MKAGSSTMECYIIEGVFGVAARVAKPVPAVVIELLFQSEMKSKSSKR